MTAYFLTFFILIASLIQSLLFKKSTKVLFVLSGLVLILISGLRYDVGVDYQSYLELFDRIGRGYNPYTEFGFDTIVKLFLFAGLTYQSIFLFFSTLTVVFFLKYIYYFSRYKYLSLFLFFSLPVFYFASFNQIRQFLAVAIFAYSLRYIYNKNIFKYIVFIVLASTIHTTVLLMLPLYFILNKKVSISLYIIYLIGVFLFLQIVDLVISTLGISQVYLNKLTEDNGVNPFAYVLLLILIFSIYTKEFLKGKELFINMLFFATLISFLPMFTDILPGAVVRMTSYFSISLLIIIPEYINYFKNKNLKIIYFLGVLSLSILYLSFTIVNKGNIYNLVPYELNLVLFNSSSIL